ncbi:hypothetical protein DP939_06670 [Spongiactinospora rosea]|uniref:Uncharacterized protein n=1 Tax=Spongiactinospora rosea TaxID=2248750 RepID=A0A366M3I1_9ACTN|nr:hypothetical protein [Spongiactinospora rosea]RBQ20756.1 hypothetical protein DP939_06670 [Spongiactinospora rosea]
MAGVSDAGDGRWWSVGEVTVEWAQPGNGAWLLVGDTSPAGTAVWVSRARWGLFLARVKSRGVVPVSVVDGTDLVVVRVGDVVPGVWLPVLTTWDHWREFEDAVRGGRFDHV